MNDFPPFPGFRDEALAFLTALKHNNRRDWFKPRKETYEDEVLWPFRCLIADAARRTAALGLPLTGNPKRAIFRIYRDTRFSKNKNPYKTHAGAVFSRTGEPKEPGGLYVHVEPGASFLAAGYWRPATPLLRAWRTRMAEAPPAFLDMIHQLEASGLSFGEARDALKRMPRGFENLADTELADHLRRKSFVVSRAVPDDALQSPAFTEAVVQMMQDALPLLDYGWRLDGMFPQKP